MKAIDLHELGMQTSESRGKASRREGQKRGTKFYAATLATEYGTSGGVCVVGSLMVGNGGAGRDAGEGGDSSRPENE